VLVDAVEGAGGETRLAGAFTIFLSMHDVCFMISNGTDLEAICMVPFLTGLDLVRALMEQSSVRKTLCHSSSRTQELMYCERNGILAMTKSISAVWKVHTVDSR
jgi:hypothetical protein